MIVILNNGTRIRISQVMVQAIFQNILKNPQGARQWHCMMDTEQKALSGFNLAEVAAICKEEDIIKESRAVDDMPM